MKIRHLCAAATLSGLVATAHAGLVGDTVSATQASAFAASLSSNSALVTAGGPELQYLLGLNRFIDIDIQDTYIDFTFAGPINALFGDSPTKITIGDIDTLIDNVVMSTFDFLDPFVGPMSGNFATFTGNSVSLDFRGVWDAGDRVRLDITFASSTVPEPGALGLAGLALGVLAYSRRRRA